MAPFIVSARFQMNLIPATSLENRAPAMIMRPGKRDDAELHGESDASRWGVGGRTRISRHPFVWCLLNVFIRNFPYQLAWVVSGPLSR